MDDHFYKVSVCPISALCNAKTQDYGNNSVGASTEGKQSFHHYIHLLYTVTQSTVSL